MKRVTVFTIIKSHKGVINNKRRDRQVIIKSQIEIFKLKINIKKSLKDLVDKSKKKREALRNWERLEIPSHKNLMLLKFIKNWPNSSKIKFLWKSRRKRSSANWLASKTSTYSKLSNFLT